MYSNTWEAETRQLLAYYEDQLKSKLQLKDSLLKKIDELDQQTAVITQLKKSISDTLIAHIEMISIVTKTELPITVTELKGKKPAEALRFIAKKNNNILLGNAAIKLMVAAGIYKVAETASTDAYKQIGRMREFHKISDGIYQLDNNYKPRGKSHRVTTGILDVVRKIYIEKPDTSKDEIIETLKKKGFDFMGKNPSLSVAFALRKVIKENTNRQPSLLV